MNRRHASIPSSEVVGLRMPVKTYTGSALFGPVPDRNSRDYALTAIIESELLYNQIYQVKSTSAKSDASREGLT